MTFRSILFPRPGTPIAPAAAQEPACFTDLRLDHIVTAVTAGKDEYELAGFFYQPLTDIDDVLYRQHVMQDLENTAVFQQVTTFAEHMRAVRAGLARAEKSYYKEQQERYFLDAAGRYCDAVQALRGGLEAASPRSDGLTAFCGYLARYEQSLQFRSLTTECRRLQQDLAAVHYAFLLKGNRVRVQKFDAEPEYSPQVERTFEKFRQSPAKDYTVRFLGRQEMNHVEASILQLVAKLFPDEFLRLEQFRATWGQFQDDTVRAFDREIQFYIAYLDYIGRLRTIGHPFCYPRVVDDSKQVHADDGFDLALADKLFAGKPSTDKPSTDKPLAGNPSTDKMRLVHNDFSLQADERVFVVSGPNQGGKTTFARMFGQLHFLASIGCPVPGRSAQLFLFDQIFTHFEREESVATESGKLQDDLQRMHDILQRATPRSIVILNEIFTSTTLQDAVFLATEVMKRLCRLEVLCVCVTFLEELAGLNDSIVSLASTVVPDNPALRTYKIVRKPADGKIYAISIAEKYRLTYAQVKERIRS